MGLTKLFTGKNGIEKLYTGKNGILTKWFIKLLVKMGLTKWFTKLLVKMRLTKWFTKLLVKMGLTKWFTKLLVKMGSRNVALIKMKLGIILQAKEIDFSTFYNNFKIPGLNQF